MCVHSGLTTLPVAGSSQQQQQQLHCIFVTSSAGFDFVLGMHICPYCVLLIRQAVSIA